MNKEDVIQNFEKILYMLKTPYLQATEVSSESENTLEQQDTSILGDIEKQLDKLYIAIKYIIDKNDTIHADDTLNKHGLYQLLERKGICTALKNDPELKPDLMYSLNNTLKEYPFAYTRSHMHKLIGTPSKIEIIPNKV